jgi:hypothetical protein
MMDESKLLLAQAEKLRASGLLGRTRLLRLFDFLVDASLQGESPKGAVIAAAVFGHRSAAAVGEDASVRVYVHNLRRRLDSFYNGAGRAEIQRIAIPKGAYRLVLEPWGASAPATDTAELPVLQPPAAHMAWLLPAVGALLVLGFALLWGLRPAPTPAQRAAASPMWARLLDNGRPTLLVVGDYYLFGDTENGSDVRRLVREFNINSRSELEQFLSANPKLAPRYMDVGLGYLPTSSAFAMNHVLPVFGGHAPPRVVLRSELDPELLRTANIVYVGLLSGLGSLRSTVFMGSRFTLGESYDELIDRKTQQHYVSEVAPLEAEAGGLVGPPRYRDYGYFATFQGLAGNRIIVIAGTRDEGLRETAEVLASRAALDTLRTASQERADFEALYEVSGMDRVNLGGRLVLASPLDANVIWGPGPTDAPLSPAASPAPAR